MKYLVRIVLAAALCTAQSAAATPANEKIPARVISLAPSITETIYALDLESKLIAVTSYCKYPPEAQNLPQLGGLFDTSLEKLVSLKPDLVIMLGDHAGLNAKLKKLKINTLSVTNESIEEIYATVDKIGSTLGEPTAAKSLVADLKFELQAVSKSQDYSNMPSALIVVDSGGGSTISSVYAAGKKTFFDDVLSTAGFANSASRFTGYPTLSAEGIAALDPQIIIDISLSPSAQHRAKLSNAWNQLGFLRAVKNERLFLMERQETSFPGPRFVDTVKAFSYVKNKATKDESSN